MADQSEGHYSDIDWVVNHLYASRHYVGLQTFEGGIRVWICDWLCRNWADYFILVPRVVGKAPFFLLCWLEALRQSSR